LKVLVDTNVILDAIAAREPFRQDAERIILMAAEEKIEGFISAKSITDIYYVARRNLSEKAVREALRNLFSVFSILAVDSDDCKVALDFPLEDYEDAILAVCGHRAGMDCIISRDKDFLESNTILQVVSPPVFLKTHTS
jgi:predicted nucleic acid-binding protein